MPSQPPSVAAPADASSDQKPHQAPVRAAAAIVAGSTLASISVLHQRKRRLAQSTAARSIAASTAVNNCVNIGEQW